MAENAPVQRFMLLATARTGSNLLSSLLSAHPAIKMYGELFNLDTIARKDLLDALDDPQLYLRKRLYKDHRPEIAAVGFKMFYDHLTKDYFEKPVALSDASERFRNKIVDFASFIDANYDWPTLSQRFRDTWHTLAEDRDLAVIHLRRRNALDTLISLKTAFVTGEFWSLNLNGDKTSHRDTITTIHLSPDECQRYFEKVHASADEADTLFATHPKLDVTYEDLVASRDEVVQKVTEFLHVPYLPVSTRMQKQIAAPASDIVANYVELKDCFRDTKWQAFFD
jgi:LPS sulfotransferase NodH